MMFGGRGTESGKFGSEATCTGFPSSAAVAAHEQLDDAEV